MEASQTRTRISRRSRIIEGEGEHVVLLWTWIVHGMALFGL